MPIYLYECESCGSREEVLFSMKDRNNSVNCSCGDKMTRVPAPAHAKFVGPGFYETEKRAEQGERD